MIKSDNISRASSNGVDIFKEMGKKLLDALDSSKVKKTATPAEASSKNKNETSEANSGDASNSGATAGKNSEKEVVKIFISSEDLTDLNSGEVLFYFGVYSPQKNILHCAGKLLDNSKPKTLLGYYMEAWSYAFTEAKQRGIDRLHILSDYKAAVQIMTRFQKQYKKYGDTDISDFPFACTPDDYVNFYVATSYVPEFKSLKFEYVPSNDQTYKEMVQLRKIVDQYATKHPM